MKTSDEIANLIYWAVTVVLATVCMILLSMKR
jgi:hypothetical protein